jgi:hypothetical protein
MTTPKSPSYLWAAFNARPFGMPVPPNWFAIAAIGLLGAFLNPGFWLLGAGLELGYLYALSQSKRFRRAVDATADRGDPADARYRALLEPLTQSQRERQLQVERRAAEILQTLAESPLMASHADSVEQLVWLHLRLLAARSAVARVVQGAEQDSVALARHEAQIDARLAEPALTPELRRSLEQQKSVIDARQEAHANAARRLEHIDAELARIDQQVALIREQTLLASDEERIATSLDALASSFNESSRWLASQRDLLGAFETDDMQRLPARVLRSQSARRSVSE